MLVLTFLVNLNSAVFFPDYVTDAFSWGAFLLCLPPILWAAYLLFRYHTRGERIVTYLAIPFALYWFLPAIGLGAQFGFRKY